MNRSLPLSLVFFIAACIGGQPPRTKQQSRALGDQSADVPAATRQEKDWTAAARGHEAAGPMGSAELAELEKHSTPGAHVARSEAERKKREADAGGP